MNCVQPIHLQIKVLLGQLAVIVQKVDHLVRVQHRVHFALLENVKMEMNVYNAQKVDFNKIWIHFSVLNAQVDVTHKQELQDVVTAVRGK